MANRFPLIFNSGAGQIQELAASDNLDLTSSNLVNAGILFTSSGSVTAPSLQIGSGTTYNPGLYSPGTDQVAVATNGTGRLFIDASGNIGVGISSPAFGAIDHGVHIKGSSAQEGIRLETTNGSSGILEIYAENGGSTLDTRGSGYIRFNSATTEFGRWDSSGRLGIGTSSVNTKLEIAGNNDAVTENNTLRFTDTDANTEANQQIGKIEFYSSDASTPGAGVKAYIGAFAADTTPDAYLAFATQDGSVVSTPVERVRITSDGKLGLGTNAPGSPLDIAKAASVDTSGADNKWTARFRDTTATAINVGGGLLFQGIKSAVNAVGNFGAIAGLKENATDNNENGYLAFYTTTNSTGLLAERLRITSAGLVGIGVTGPLGFLDVKTSADRRLVVQHDTNIQLKAANDSDAPESLRIVADRFIFKTGTTGNGTEAVRIDTSGRLLVGTATSPGGGAACILTDGYARFSKVLGQKIAGSSYTVCTLSGEIAGKIKIISVHNDGANYKEYSFCYSTNGKALSLIHDNSPYAPGTITLSLNNSTGVVSTNSLSYNTEMTIVVECLGSTTSEINVVFP